MEGENMSEPNSTLHQERADIVTVKDAEGATVWEGTTAMFGLTLAAMRIPEDDFDPVANQVNAFPEVAHNYRRNHAFNMWFVLATETPEAIDETLERIEKETGYPVYNFPKEEGFFIGLKFEV